MKIVNASMYKEYLEELRLKARRKVKLLQDKEVTISDEAQRLIDGIDQDETDYLFSKVIRTREARSHDRKIFT